MNIIKRIGKILLSILSFILFMTGMLYVLFYANMLIYCVRTGDYYIFDYVVIRLVIALIVVLLGIFLLFQNKIIHYFKELDARIKERERQAKVLEERKRLREEQEETDKLEFERRFGLEEQTVEETEKERNKRYAREAWEAQQAKNKKLLKKKAFEEKKRLLNEKYTDIPFADARQKTDIHMCSQADPIFGISVALGVLMSIGSLLTAFALAPSMDDEHMLLFAGITTLIFWVGVFLAIVGYFYNIREKRVVYVSTDQQLLYIFNPNAFFIKPSRIPINKLARIVYYHKLSQKNNLVIEKLEAFLKDREQVEKVLDGLINDNEPNDIYDKAVIKLNSPILKKRAFVMQIKYWDEKLREWCLIELPKYIEGYDEICQLIAGRNINIER